MRKAQGQGLIETLVVVLFIAVGVIALVKFQNYLGYSAHVSQQQSEATFLSEAKLESLRDFVVVNPQGNLSAYQNIASGSDTVTLNNTAYTRTWTVTTSADPKYKTLDIVLTWTDRYGASQSVNLTTRVAGIDPAFSASII